VSFAVDVNVLVYASNVSSTAHAKAKALLDRHAQGRDLLYLPWPVAMGYLRITTSPAILPHPLTAAEAEHNLDLLLARPNVRVLAEGEGFWDVYRDVTRAAPVRGAHVTDAHIAALLRQHGVRVLYTNDPDFRRYPFLDVKNPFAG